MKKYFCNTKSMNLKSLVIRGLSVLYAVFFIPLDLFSGDFYQPPDSSFIELRGIVKDKDTKDGIPYASVFLTGTNIGTVSNTEGLFTLKVPSSKSNGKIGVSCLGYKNIEVLIPELEKNRNEILLQLTRYYIRELTIRKVDPVQLLRDVIQKIPENYGNSPAMMTAFYRESIRQNRSYVAVSEAVFDVYKAPYSHFIDNDRIKIFKGRKSQDVTKMDTVIFRLQGGPFYLFMLDLVKNPEDLLSEESFNFYNYKFIGLETVEDRDAYVIGFDQKEGLKNSLFKGKMYIDVKTLALSGVEFGLSPEGIEFAPDLMIRKKPAGMKIEIPGANYIIKYRLINGRWFLSYARTEARFRCKWDKKLFKSGYTTVSEMAITDIDTININRFKTKDASRASDVFSEQVGDLADPEFWGEYNIIRPEESIEEATRKLAKKLQRN